MKRVLAASAAALALTLTLAACSSSGDDPKSSQPKQPAMSGSMSGMSMSGMPMSDMPESSGAVMPASGPHNKADISFATDMIPHHRQAVQMASMAVSTSKNAGVLKLAKAIKAAQDPEINKMSGWLRGWKQPVPSGSMHHMGGGSMPGMMSDADMAKLAKATGTEFDKMWLSMMIEHHKGAVSMARTELSDGSNPDAKTLARSIIASQSAEITTMTKLASSL